MTAPVILRTAMGDRPRKEQERTTCRQRGGRWNLQRGLSELHSEQVGFCYAQSERWAVRGLSLTLPAGEKLALVGENGAGKTTVVKLLARLYDPTEGRILLDGHDLREYDVQELRRKIGIIFQDFVRYQLTAADNIAVGRIEEREDLPGSRAPPSGAWRTR